MKHQGVIVILVMIIAAEVSAQSKSDTRPDGAGQFNAQADELMKVGKVKEAIPLYEKAAEKGMASAKGRADLAKAKLRYTAPSDQDKAQISAVINATCEGFLKGDVDAVMTNYSPQAVEIPPNHIPNVGGANIRSRLQEILSSGSYTRFHRQLNFIQGGGPIAVASGTTESTFEAPDGNSYEQKRDDLFIFRKRPNGEWKVVAHHLSIPRNVQAGNSSDDEVAIRHLIDKWNFFIKPDQVFGPDHVENLVAIHSDQAIDIRPNLRSVVGMPNLRVLWTGFTGIKWAQFTDYNFEVNSFQSIGGPDFAHKAVAWGIGDHSSYRNGSTERSQYLFPWAMILTKEQGGWKILVYHFYLE